MQNEKQKTGKDDKLNKESKKNDLFFLPAYKNSPKGYLKRSKGRKRKYELRPRGRNASQGILRGKDDEDGRKQKGCNKRT